MKAFALSVATLCLVTALSACAPKGEYKVAVDDDRFDLMAFNMPDLLTTDAKKCVASSRLLRGQGGEQDVIAERLFESVLDLWQVVDVSFLSSGEPRGVLPDGGDPADVETIFPTLMLPTAVGHACGEYAGQVAVKIGLLSLSDSIDAALKSDPSVFEDLGMDLDQVYAGLSVIEAQAEGLSGLPVEDKVGCMAVYQAARVSDEALAPFVSIWLTSLVGAVESGQLDPREIRERSVYWQALAEGGVDAVVAVDGFQEKAAKCDGWINTAIAEQATEL